MSFRNLYIKDSKQLSLENNQIKILKKNNDVIYFGLDDINSIFVESPDCILTNRLITYISNKNILLFLCDNKYMPSTIAINLYGSYKMNNMLKLQFDLLSSKKEKLWEKIIEKKIINHAFVIGKYFSEENKYKILNLLDNLKTGDKNFVEPIEARIYFRILFGEDFIRHQTDPINLALDYGYSIINGAIIRSLVASGFNTQLGIHHDSKENFNNLASDIIEPYRAFVDNYVYEHKEFIVTAQLSSDIRMGLIKLLDYTVKIDNMNYKLSDSIRILVYSLCRYYQSGNIKEILLPGFLE